MAEDIEPLRKATAPVHAVGTSSTTATRPSLKAREEVEKRFQVPGQSSTRSRSQGKSTGSRSQPRTPVQGKSFSPVRTVSPGAERGAEVSRNSRTRGGMSATMSRNLSASTLSSRNTLLEKELKDSHNAHAELEQKLGEERSRAVADREQLAKLLCRIEQLESSREVNAALLEDNRFLRAELEAEKLEVQELNKQLECLRGETPPPTVVLSTAHQQLLQENAKLRSDLQQSQLMLAKYTEELQTIMPDVELILNQWKVDSHVKGPDGAAAPLQRPAETGVDATRLDGRGASLVHASSTGRSRDLPAGGPQAAVNSVQDAAEVDLRERQLSALTAAARSYQHAASASRPLQRPKSPTTRAGASQGSSRASGSRPRSAGRGLAAAAGVRSSTSPQPRPVPAQVRSGTGRQGKLH